jgi:hypothetical protein
MDAGEMKGAIDGEDDLPLEPVDVPEWPKVGKVWLRTLTGTERDKFESDNLAFKERAGPEFLKDFRSRLLVRTLADSKGQRLYQDGEVAAVAKRSGKVLDRLYDAACRLNGLGQYEGDAAKNSAGAPGAASSSASPTTSAAPSASSSPESPAPS